MMFGINFFKPQPVVRKSNLGHVSLNHGQKEEEIFKRKTCPGGMPAAGKF
jgi:hypothetical protein